MAHTKKTPEPHPVQAYSYGRLSQSKQKDGTGQERQMELAKAWCERKGILLDETLSYFDSMSGFHGAHRTRKDGGLRLFLAACEEKRVRPGSFLLVESLDRLSREQLQEGQRLLHRLLFDYKIILVVLFSGAEYTAANYQDTHWAIDAEFSRAHSESLTKSIRSKDNWDRRRRGVAKGGLLTSKVPTWLRVTDGKIVADEGKAAVVRRVFDLSVKGFGFGSIAKRLNAEKVPVFGRAKFWRDSIVEKILKSRSVLGEHRAMTGSDEGKRVPVGPVLVGYFPPVVTVGEWLAAHQAIKSRLTARGLVSPKVSNLFTHLVRDEAGDAMAYTSKCHRGYLQSGRKDSPGIRYSHFERVLLSWLREVKLNLSNTADIAGLRVRADKLAADLKTLKSKIDADPEELGELLDSYLQKKRDHAALVAEIESVTVPLQSHFLQAQRLVEALKNAKGDKRETLRREFRQAVRMVVTRIDVKVKGEKYRGKTIYMTVTFKDGLKRLISYHTRAGRVTLVDVTCVEGDPFLAEFEAGLRQTLGDQKPTLDDRVLHAASQGLFMGDPDPTWEVRQKCKAMRAAGKSYKEIEAETGLHRTSIYRHINDYVRPDRKK